jgi:glycosyltransferase involved in cell wall biosynthesis
MKSKLFIPVICYNHSANTEYMMSLIKLSHHLRDVNIEYVLFPIVFDSLVSRARNAAVAHFLASDCSHLIFIDADIEFEPESVIKLLNHNKEVIAGVYPKKYFIFERFETGEEVVDFPVAGEVSLNEDGLINSTYLPTGFLMISRTVFDKMIIAYPELKYKNDIDGYGRLETFYDFFRVSVNNGILESEDWGFCSLWRAIGGKVLLDATILLGHIGLTRYSGNPWKWCQESINRHLVNEKNRKNLHK